jgi:3-oxoacyl-[acyl-carrier-protein] synthase II
LGPVAGELGPTDGDNTVARLDALAARTGMANAGMIVSSASGGHSRTAQEMHYLSSAFPGTPVRGISTSFGHLRDAQFPAAIAIAALALGKGAPVPVLDPSFETESAAAPDTIGVITVGFSRSEGMALLGKAQGMDA